MSELEMLRLKMNQRTDESLESTRRMVTMAEESHQMGAATLETLHHQGGKSSCANFCLRVLRSLDAEVLRGWKSWPKNFTMIRGFGCVLVIEQLDHVNDQMNVIHEDIKNTEKNLDNLEKCCGIFKLPWKRVSRPGSDKHFKPKDYSTVTVQPTNGTYSKDSKRGDVAQSQPSGPFITRILDDDREDEMEQNLGHVSNIVGELKAMATDMNSEIKTHNAKLESMANKVFFQYIFKCIHIFLCTVDNQARLEAAQMQATRIVGKPAKPNDPLIPQPDQLNSGSGSSEDTNLRREYEQLQEEAVVLRQEADQRLLAASKIEEKAFEEHASLRRTVSLLEQQLQREKQLLSDSDAEIIDLQRRLNLAEEASKRDLASLNGQLRSAEAEVTRLRRCLASAETSPKSPDSPLVASPSPSTRSRNFDTEARIFELQTNVQQLNDALLTKQDALEATLVQNHALKASNIYLSFVD
ncbi:unnamed protein product [Rodentolepis nana]|uniref:t-SNARE coiled-coil homology domain-containing protein n=1 Tax=Rodentolepis nana TaxID=102285 RepID=A0A158QJB3_RODNA|nr:unnamed protein product [Rodentolepis nana]